MTQNDDDDAAPAWAREEHRTVIAPPEATGRLDAWLAGLWPDLSRARIQGLIGQGKLTLYDAPVTHASSKVRPGGVYVLTLPPPAPPSPQPESIALDVAFEDDHLIVVNKPAGMAAHPAAGSLTGTLVHALLHHCAASLSGVGGVARPGIVHRIDKDTTGLIVAAKSDAAHAGLARQFAKHTIERAYFAITRAAPPARSGVIDTHLIRSSEDRRKMSVVRDPASTSGKRAITHYWTIETFGQIAGQGVGRPAAALVECRLETGRTHQIRAHLAHLGCPLVGDPVYGRQRGFKVEGAAAAHAKTAVETFSRQALHAAVLGFDHPITAERRRFEAPMPADMAGLAQALRALL